jgi:hypothetical protein
MEGNASAQVPDFELLTSMVIMEQWHQLPHLPTEYQLGAIEKGKAKVSGAKPEIEKPPEPATPGKKVLKLNVGINAEWKAHLEASTKWLKDLEGLAPTTTETDPKTNKKLSLCLGWHLLGQCYDNCRRAKTHRKLSTAEEVAMQKLVTENLQE